MKRMTPSRGFTLTELMITVAIIGILAGVGVPSYRAYVERGNRSVAKSALSDVASRQETWFGERKRYAASLTDLDYAGPYLFRDGRLGATRSADAIYQFSLAGNPASLTCPPGGSPNRSGYTLVATPIQSQGSDGKCGTLCYSSTGVRTASGSAGADCWKR